MSLLKHPETTSIRRHVKNTYNPVTDRKVLVIYVGGTLGMKVNEKGSLDICPGYLTEELINTRNRDVCISLQNNNNNNSATTDSQAGAPPLNASGGPIPPQPSHQIKRETFPELIDKFLKPPTFLPFFDIYESPQLKDSSQMGMKDWVDIAKDVEKNYFLYDGIVVAHGTDTMHFTAAALSFLLENLAKPVIVTGAMVPFSEPYNDAKRNIIISILLAATSDICEVCIFANDVLLRGNRALKTRFTMSCFESPNYPQLALLGAGPVTINQQYLLPQPKGAFRAARGIHIDREYNVLHFIVDVSFPIKEFAEFVKRYSRMNNKVSIDEEHKFTLPSVLLPPSVNPKETTEAHHHNNNNNKTETHPAFAVHSTGLIDCVVLEIMGISGARSSSLQEKEMKEIIIKAFNSVVDAGVVLIVTGFALYGGLTPDARAYIRSVCPMAVIVRDMTSETAVVKALYLFYRNFSPSDVRRYMSFSIVGELTEERDIHVSMSHL
eukprot:Tbor_TRINITY_DN5634_c2_g1::TRINITY_DN5634_c2_g1_i1::g.9299::m.9299/K01424/E3.5.1.1, ansA, ansB; L-asparaginase